MAAGAQEQAWAGQSRRRSPRFQVQAPVDVTVLRSGIPERLPGRTLNLCDRGIGAMLAGELIAGEAVAIEVRLPMVADPLRARATVRHQDKLRCGLEFVGLTAEQRGVIRDWARETKAESDVSTSPKPATEKQAEKAKEKQEEKEQDRPPEKRRTEPPKPGRVRVPSTTARGRRGMGPRRAGWTVVFVLVALVALIFWRRWTLGWEQLESGLNMQQSSAQEKPPVQVPAEVMESLLIHRVEPTYPPEARRENLQGLIALDIIVGRDGSVVSMRALNGPDVLAHAAMDALRWWKFEPYRVNGEPAVAETTVAVEFKR
jgi:TonB family protein